MKITVPMEYLGKDINGNPIVNEKKSGLYVLGLNASVEEIGIVVVKIYYNYCEWTIVEDFIATIININEGVSKTKEWITKYHIEHAFGNNISKHICKLDSSFDNSGNQRRGHEVINLEAEEAHFLVQGSMDKIAFTNVWMEILNSYDLYDGQNSKIFALANVLTGAKPETTMFENIPDIVINKSENKTSQTKSIPNPKSNGFPFQPPIIPRR